MQTARMILALVAIFATPLTIGCASGDADDIVAPVVQNDTEPTPPITPFFERGFDPNATLRNESVRSCRVVGRDAIVLQAQEKIDLRRHDTLAEQIVRVTDPQTLESSLCR